MDKASAAEHFAQKHRLGEKAIDYTRTIEVSAEIRLGEILRDMGKNKGGNPNLRPVEQDDQLATLSEIGISKGLSAKAQDLAGLSVVQGHVAIIIKGDKTTVFEKPKGYNREYRQSQANQDRNQVLMLACY